MESQIHKRLNMARFHFINNFSLVRGFMQQATDNRHGNFICLAANQQMQSRSGTSSGWMTKKFNLIAVISLLPRSDSGWIIAMWYWSFDAPAVQLLDGSQIGLLAAGNNHFFRQSSHYGFSTETLLETTKTFYNINRNFVLRFSRAYSWIFVVISYILCSLHTSKSICIH